MVNKKQKGGSMREVLQELREAKKQYSSIVRVEIKEKQDDRRKKYAIEQAKKETLKRIKDREQMKEDAESGDEGIKLALKKLMRNINYLLLIYIMEVSINEVLYISVIALLFVILNAVIMMKSVIKSFSIIIIFICLVALVVLATLSTIKKN